MTEVKTIATPQEEKLCELLKEKGIDAIPEYYDGHKHIDIAILDAKMYIEINGLHHYIDPKTIEADLIRDHFSDGDDFHTFRITNQIIEKYCEEVAEAIASIVNKKKKQI